jgi:hypothetical protein
LNFPGGDSLESTNNDAGKVTLSGSSILSNSSKVDTVGKAYGGGGGASTAAGGIAGAAGVVIVEY